MPIPYAARYVKCPFYRGNDSNSIVCEGLNKGNTIHIVYKSKAEKKNHMDRHCDSIEGCCHCRVYQMLYKKYE